MNKENFFDIIDTLLILVFVGIGILFVYELNEFYEDYKCSTTTDFEYFKKNNCIRFVK